MSREPFDLTPEAVDAAFESLTAAVEVPTAGSIPPPDDHRWVVAPAGAGGVWLNLEGDLRNVLGNQVVVLRQACASEGDIRARLCQPQPADSSEDEDPSFAVAAEVTLAGMRAVRYDRFLATVRATILDAEEAQAWLGTLNDLRIALATRCGVTADSRDEDLEALFSQRPEVEALMTITGALVQVILQASAGGPAA